MSIGGYGKLKENGNNLRYKRIRLSKFELSKFHCIKFIHT